MAVTLYAGQTGAGKSYGVVEHVILPSLEQGRTIVTNLELLHDAIDEHVVRHGWPDPDIRQIDLSRAREEPEYLIEGQPKGAVFVLDEVWELWPAGQKVHTVPVPHLDFVKKHRHRVNEEGLANEIVLITQEPSDLAAWVRGLVREMYYADKLDLVGAPDRYRVDVYKKAPTGERKGKPIRQLFGRYRPEVYKFYRSHTESDNRWGKAHEKKVDQRANIWRSASVRWGLPASLALIVLGGWGAVNAFEQATGQPSVPERKAVVVSPSPAAAPTVDTKPIEPVQPVVSVAAGQVAQTDTKTESGYSRVWRLAAVIQNEATGRGEAYAIGRNSLRQVPWEDCYQQEGTREWVCELDGELVARWSGVQASNWANSNVEQSGF